MVSKLTYPKEKFRKELEVYIDKGNQILIEGTNQGIIENQFVAIETEFKYWEEEVSEFLKQRFDNPDNEYLDSFVNVRGDINSLSDVMRGASPSDIRYRFKYFRSNVEPKIQSLISLNRRLNLIPEKSKFSDNLKHNYKMNEKKVFISHSSKDSAYVEKLINILEDIGVRSEQIFCSSFEGYGVKLGKDFLDVIKSELNSEVFVLFVLSSNFYDSVVSLCEMGATWVKTNRHIPILIPPFEYKDVKGVLPTTHGMKINEKAKLNTLKEVMEEFFSLSPIQLNVWERKRDNILKEIKQMLEHSIPVVTESNDKPQTSLVNSPDLSYYDNPDDKIKQFSIKEWPDDFEMQEDYIQNQRNAIEKLKLHNPVDIDKNKFLLIRERARTEWPDDFEMQLDTEQRQVESLRRLNEM